MKSADFRFDLRKRVFLKANLLTSVLGIQKSDKADEGSGREVLQAKCAGFLPSFSLKIYKYGQKHFSRWIFLSSVLVRPFELFQLRGSQALGAAGTSPAPMRACNSQKYLETPLEYQHEFVYLSKILLFF